MWHAPSTMLTHCSFICNSQPILPAFRYKEHKNMFHFPIAFLAMNLLAAPSSMTNVLLIGSATHTMLEKLDKNGISVYSFRDTDVGMDWLRENGHQITYVMTNGHDGLPRECMPLLPNLKLISCNGVGYDG